MTWRRGVTVKLGIPTSSRHGTTIEARAEPYKPHTQDVAACVRSGRPRRVTIGREIQPAGAPVDVLATTTSPSPPFHLPSPPLVSPCSRPTAHPTPASISKRRQGYIWALQTTDPDRRQGEHNLHHSCPIRLYPLDPLPLSPPPACPPPPPTLSRTLSSPQAFLATLNMPL
ncbi:hypothetical protein C8J57DRAFT_1216436 [Mycena rebaudengoi]|nr:hypothetical protein C8J57DRAFT_1216436 [Mycena rebaudengoi]